MDYIARGVFYPAGGAGTVFIPMYRSPVGLIQDGSESAATEKFIIIILENEKSAVWLKKV